MLKAVIMDFDGVVLDTEKVWYEIFRDWLEKQHGYELSIEEFSVCVGSDDELLFSKLAKEQHIMVDVAAFKQETNQWFIERSKDLPEMIGVTDFIKTVKNSGLQLALATSSKREKPTFHLNRLGLIDYFDVIVTAEQVAHIKPAPDLFQAAVAQLKIEPEEALIIEDSYNGLIAGNRAGIPVIAVPNAITIHSDFNTSKATVTSLRDINLADYSDGKER